MNITLKRWQMLILIFMILISFSVSVILLADFDKATHYNLLFVLPLLFASYLLVYAKMLKSFFDNLGLTMILGLLFTRLVISPFNTSISIILVAYKTIVIMTALFILVKKVLTKRIRIILLFYTLT